MRTETIKEILINRNGMSSEDADNLISEALEDLQNRLTFSPFSLDDFCEEWFGLEPDYLDELLSML